MTMLDALSLLCYYDQRNPYSYGTQDDPGDEAWHPRSIGCSCDNCFYNRDGMAVILVRLMGDRGVSTTDGLFAVDN